MIAREQEPEQRPILLALHWDEWQRPQLGQRTLHRPLLTPDGAKLAIAQTVH